MSPQGFALTTSACALQVRYLRVDPSACVVMQEPAFAPLRSRQPEDQNVQAYVARLDAIVPFAAAAGAQIPVQLILQKC